MELPFDYISLEFDLYLDNIFSFIEFSLNFLRNQTLNLPFNQNCDKIIIYYPSVLGNSYFWTYSQSSLKISSFPLLTTIGLSKLGGKGANLLTDVSSLNFTLIVMNIKSI